MEPPYDIFISYRSLNHAMARRIRDGLVARGKRVYLDDEMLVGVKIVPALGQLIHDSKSVLLLIGPEDMGNYQEMELDTAVNLAITQNKRILPVLLPDAEIPARWSVLRGYSSFYVRSGLDDAELDQLFRAIYGKMPAAPASAPVPPAPAPEQAGSPQEQAFLEEVSAFAAHVQAGPVTFYLGERALHEATRVRPNSYELSHRLFQAVELIDKEYVDFLPTYDVAGLFYANTPDGAHLPNAVIEVLMEEAGEIPRTHLLLARLLGAMRRPRPRVRNPGGACLLVVTTNLDLWMERALLAGRVPFTRIVQMPGTGDLQWQVIKYTADFLDGIPDSAVAGAPDVDQLDRMLEAPDPEWFGIAADRPQERRSEHGFQLYAYPQPILYKFHGSQDLPASCTISTDQFIDSARRSYVPEDISNVIGNTPALFLGYRLLDPPFRHLHRTLLSTAFQGTLQAHRKAMVSPTPAAKAGAYGRMEVKNWHITRSAAVDAGIRTVEAWPADFLEALLQRVGGGS